jgi:hypothetical protein
MNPGIRLVDFSRPVRACDRQRPLLVNPGYQVQQRRVDRHLEKGVIDFTVYEGQAYQLAPFHFLIASSSDLNHQSAPSQR